jgi:hypothetical protein
VASAVLERIGDQAWCERVLVFEQIVLNGSRAIQMLAFRRDVFKNSTNDQAWDNGVLLKCINMQMLHSIQRSLDLVEARLSEPVSIGEFAVSAGMSLWHF